jgi:hypothetical protein
LAGWKKLQTNITRLGRDTLFTPVEIDTTVSTLSWRSACKYRRSSITIHSLYTANLSQCVAVRRRATSSEKNTKYCSSLGVHREQHISFGVDLIDLCAYSRRVLLSKDIKRGWLAQSSEKEIAWYSISVCCSRLGKAEPSRAEPSRAEPIRYYLGYVSSSSSCVVLPVDKETLA